MSGDVSTIAALLAKAERTDNAHEAEAYLAKAQHLATLRSVDLAMVRARTARTQQRAVPVSRTVSIGAVGKRANTHLVSLFVVVAHANDVVVDVARNSTYVIAFGMPSDLDLVEQLWGSLAPQMVDAAGRYLATDEWREESYRVVVRERVGRWSVPRVQDRPHTKQTARAAFYRGFIERIGHRLKAAHDEAVAEASAAESGGLAADGTRASVDGPTTEVVLREKAAEVKAFHQRESQARGSWTGYRGAAGGDNGAATGAGRRAAANARLGLQRGIGKDVGPSLPS
ncbi:MAG: DUF2786 domain-containing protein [Jiangellales bacterium]